MWKWLIKNIGIPPKFISEKGKELINNKDIKKLIKEGKIKRVNIFDKLKP